MFRAGHTRKLPIYDMKISTAHFGEVVKLVNTADLKSATFGFMGSIPILATNKGEKC